MHNVRRLRDLYLKPVGYNNLGGGRRGLASASRASLPAVDRVQQTLRGALDSATGRCMVGLGFEYVGNPYDSDSEIPPMREPGSYEAAFLGEGDGGGGCRQSTINSMVGMTTADAYANNMVNEMAGTWERTALADPSLQARLGQLASCARAHGAVVRDTPDRLKKVFDDVQRGIETIVISDGRLMATENVNEQDIAAQRALYLQLADELCPGYSAFEVDLDEATRLPKSPGSRRTRSRWRRST